MPITPDQVIAARYRLFGIEALFKLLTDAAESSYAVDVSDEAGGKALRQEYNYLKGLIDTALDNLFSPPPNVNLFTKAEYLAIQNAQQPLAGVRGKLVRNLQVVDRALDVDEDGNVVMNLTDEQKDTLRSEILRLRNKIKVLVEEMP